MSASRASAILSLLLLLSVAYSAASYQNVSHQINPPMSTPQYLQSPLIDAPPAPQPVVQGTGGINPRVSPGPQPVPQGIAPIAAASSQAEEFPGDPDTIIIQRARIPKLHRHRYSSSARNLAGNVQPINNQILSQENISNASKDNSTLPACLYDKTYFKRMNECLAYKPYPTMGLPAFKNEDLLTRSASTASRSGCSFILSNGLFKNQQLYNFSVDNDKQCLDNDRVRLNMGFSNATLYYLWTLRCLNRADQLQDDLISMNGYAEPQSCNKSANEAAAETAGGICVGSSQNFGFAVLQLSNIEAQVELATDIYKNWRIVDITLVMAPTSHLSATGNKAAPGPSSARNMKAAPTAAQDHLPSNLLNSHIRDYTFETLDGDELNWRYLHLFRNWSLNRLHSNFLEQYRRYLWVLLQRCLSESSEKLPVRLFDLFSNQHYQ